MSFTELSEQEIIRRNSLNELAKLGIEAYPAPEFQVNAHAAEIKERFDETAEPRNVVIAGRMMSRRIMGKASFFELQDATGRIQVYVSRDDISTDEASTAYNTVFKKLMDIGDIVGVKGFVFRTQTGEISVHAKELTMLSKSLRPLPIVKEKEGVRCLYRSRTALPPALSRPDRESSGQGSLCETYQDDQRYPEFLQFQRVSGGGNPCVASHSRRSVCTSVYHSS